MMDLRTAARLLGGDIAGRNTVNCPGPGHSRKDRSMSVTFNPRAPDGFLCNSFAGDDWQSCRDHVAQLLGIERQRQSPKRSERKIFTKPIEAKPADARALALWDESTDWRGTLADTYLRRRGFSDLDWIADVRFHPSCPFGPATRHPCMVALYRDIVTDEPKAIHRTALAPDGSKIDRKAMGPKAGCAIKLSDDADVSVKLSIGEGIETCLAGAAMLFRPVWALGDAQEIRRFPVLPGIESLTVLVDNDPAGTEAAQECSARWTKAGREVFRAVPNRRKGDFADVLKEAFA